MSKFKIGDEVVCISERPNFTAELDKVYSVTEVECCGFHTIETGEGWYDDDMFRLFDGVWQPKPGEMIDVSNAKDFHDKPQIRQFFSMDDGKFVCKRSKNSFMYRAWGLARPIKTTVTIINESTGEKVEISQESSAAIFGQQEKTK